MSNAFEVDEKDFQRVISKLADLNSKEIKSVRKAALRRAAAILVKETRNNMARSFPAFKKKSKLRGDTGTYLQKVRIGRSDDKKIKVNINSLPLPSFEMGTCDRYTRGNKSDYNRSGRRYKAGAYRGGIGRWKFFERAKSATESKMRDEIDKYLSINVEKKWNKKYK